MQNLTGLKVLDLSYILLNELNYEDGKQDNGNHGTYAGQ